MSSVPDDDWTDGTEGEEFHPPRIKRDWSHVTEATPALRAHIARLAAEHPDSGEDHGPAVENTDAGRDAVLAEINERAWVSSLLAAEKSELAQWRLDALAADQHPRDLTMFARALRAPKVRNLVLAGSTGPGKTSAAIALGWAALEQGLSVRFIDQAKYVAWLTPDGMPAHPNPYATLSPAQLRARVRTCDVLILDDLGSGLEGGKAASEHASRETMQLVGDRADTPGKVTITTTNLNSELLTASFGDRLMSRLSKDARVLKFNGPDRRGKRLTF